MTCYHPRSGVHAIFPCSSRRVYHVDILDLVRELLLATRAQPRPASILVTSLAIAQVLGLDLSSLPDHPTVLVGMN